MTQLDDHNMNNRKTPYEAPETQALEVKMEAGIHQSSLDANRNDYGDSIPVEW